MGAPCLSIFDPYATITTPPGVCLGSSSSDVVCQLPSSIVANMGDREDSFYDWNGDTTIRLVKTPPRSPAARSACSARGPGQPGRADRTPPRARLVRPRAHGQFLLLTISFPTEADAVTGSVKAAKLQRRPVRYRTRPGKP